MDATRKTIITEVQPKDSICQRLESYVPVVDNKLMVHPIPLELPYSGFNTTGITQNQQIHKSSAIQTVMLSLYTHLA